MLTGRIRPHHSREGGELQHRSLREAELILRAALHQQYATQPLSILNQLTIGNTQAAQDGTFEVRNVTPGTWNVSAAGGGVSVNGAAPPRLSGNINVDVGDTDVSGVLLQLSPGVSISGRVRLEDGDLKTVFPSLGKSGPTATPITLGDTGGVMLLIGGQPAVGLNEIVLSGGSPRPGQINPVGSFKIEGINLAKFGLNMVQLPQGYYVKSARFGGSDVTHAVIDLTSGAGGSLDIVLSDKAGDLGGSIHNEKSSSMAGFIVALWTKDPDPGSTNGLRTTYADQNGSFQFRSLPPGEYYLAAWEDAEAAQLQNRDLLAMFADEDTKIKLSEGAKQSAEAKLITAEKLAAAVAKLP